MLRHLTCTNFNSVVRHNTVIEGFKISNAFLFTTCTHYTEYGKKALQNLHNVLYFLHNLNTFSVSKCHQNTFFQWTRPFIAQNTEPFPVACQQTEALAKLLTYKDEYILKKKTCETMPLLRARTQNDHSRQNQTPKQRLLPEEQEKWTSSKHLPSVTMDDSELLFTYSMWSVCVRF